MLTVTRDKADPDVRAVEVIKSNMGGSSPVTRYKVLADDDGMPRVRYVSEAEVRPQTGQDAMLAVLSTDVPLSGQELAARTCIAYSTARVLLARMIASGRASSPDRGWFLAVPVTSAGQSVASGEV